MISTIRSRYNQSFTQEKYDAFLARMAKGFGEAATFRLSETPIFLPTDLLKKLMQACEDISDVIVDSSFSEKANAAMKVPEWIVPYEDKKSLFLQYDFGICEGENGTLEPQLIELQGFPSLYYFQHLLAESYKETFDVPQGYTHLFNGLDGEGYLDILKEAILGKQLPQHVVLLDIEPETQNTRIDFWGAKKYLGISVLCLSQVIREGRLLFYMNDTGEKVQIKRIYNRIIFDELVRRDDLKRQFNLTEDVEVEWAGHPNWFTKISKFTMPSIQSSFVPETQFVNELKEIPEDLENYVLKPLFSFSGAGVIFNVTREDVESLTHPEDFILQRKVKYAACIPTTDPLQNSKCEVRMMMLWLPDAPRPILINNLVRLTKGDMVGVKYNKNKDWVGASVGFYDPSAL